jgi:hypothetical protein
LTKDRHLVHPEVSEASIVKVIIQKDCYDRIRDVFDASGLEFLVLPVSDPGAMVHAQSSSGA